MLSSGDIRPRARYSRPVECRLPSTRRPLKSCKLTAQSDLLHVEGFHDVLSDLGSPVHEALRVAEILADMVEHACRAISENASFRVKFDIDAAMGKRKAALFGLPFAHLSAVLMHGLVRRDGVLSSMASRLTASRFR